MDWNTRKFAFYVTGDFHVVLPDRYVRMAKPCQTIGNPHFACLIQLIHNRKCGGLLTASGELHYSERA
jgi:hypothetical protein